MTAAQVGDLDRLRQDPVSIQFEERDQVHEDHEVVEQREPYSSPANAASGTR